MRIAYHLTLMILGPALAVLGCRPATIRHRISDELRTETVQTSTKASRWRLLRAGKKGEQVVTEGVVVGGQLQTFWPTPAQGDSIRFDGGGLLFVGDWEAVRNGGLLLRVQTTQSGISWKTLGGAANSSRKELEGLAGRLRGPCGLVEVEVALPADLAKLEEVLLSCAAISSNIVLTPGSTAVRVKQLNANEVPNVGDTEMRAKSSGQGTDASATGTLNSITPPARGPADAAPGR